MILVYIAAFLMLLALAVAFIALIVRGSWLPREPRWLLRIIVPSTVAVFVIRGLDLGTSIPAVDVLSLFLWRSVPLLWCAFFYSYGREIASQRLIRHEYLLKTVVDNLLDGFIIVDEMGKIGTRGPGGQRIIGGKGEPEFDRNLRNYVHPDSQTAMMAGFNQLQERPDEPVRTEVKAKRRDGTWVWLEVTAVNRLSDPNIRGMICGFRDITDRRNAEAQLEQSREEYRQLVEDINDVLFTVDESGALTYISPVIRERAGYDPEELIGRRFREFIHPDDMDSAGEHIQNWRDPAAAPFELRLISKEGKPLWVRISTKVIEEDGRATGVRGVLTDVTDLMLLQDQLLQAQKMEAIGRLAGGVAHDFNNLLTAVSGYTELAQAEADPGTPLSQHLSEIMNASEKAAELTTQLLAFSRRQVMQPRVIDLNAVVQDVEAMIRRLIGETIDFRTRLAGNLGRTRADPNQLQQVLLNLALNARDAMPDGGRLVIETHNATVDLHEGENGGEETPCVALWVSDTGVGMDEEVRTRIFEPFFTTKSPGKGTGLGLAMVYGIVEQTGGRIWVYSEPGRGSTFKIYLQRVDAELDQPPKSEPIPLVATGDETVLLVEDERLVRDLTREALERAGYRVLHLSSAEDALEALAEMPSPPDLIISDVVLPGINGFEMVERIRSRLPDIRSLYMSGYSEDTLQFDTAEMQEMNYLRKPFGVQQLLHEVRRVLDG